MSFSGDSNSLAVSCGNDVILCDSSTWLPVAETTTDTSFDKIRIKGDEMVGQVVYSPDSSMLAITTALTSNGSGCRLCTLCPVGERRWYPRMESTGNTIVVEQRYERRHFSSFGVSRLLCVSHVYCVSSLIQWSHPSLSLRQANTLS
jgi:hypothetical protein